MNELLNKDITIKIVSVLVAVLLWMYVLNEQNPYENRDLTIKLNIINRESLEDKGLVLKNENIRDTIDITIRGREEIVNSIRSGDFIATLDFSRVNSVSDGHIRVDKPEYDLKDITLVSYSPRTIDIELERIKEDTFPVELSVSSKLKENYKVISVTHTPETFKLTDVESVIDNIGSIKAIVSINNLKSSLDVKKECKAYDKNGKEMLSLSRDLSVDVNVVIGKEVPVDLVLKGKPAQDYVEISRDIKPKKVLITGPYKVIQGIDRLQTEPVDMSNISEDLKSSSVIELPDGVRLVDAPEEVSVTVDIEKLVRKDFTVKKEDISLKNSNANDMYKYEIANDTAVFTVKGLDEDLKSLSMQSFRPYVDVNGLEPGTHNLPLRIYLPYEVELIERPQIEVKIQQVEEEQEQEASGT